MASKKLTEGYRLLTQLANTEEAGSLAKDRSVLLLWFLRNSVGIDDIEAYDYICDGNRDGGIDAIYLEPSPGYNDFETLILYQSKYTQSADHLIGPNDIKHFVATANRFRGINSLRSFIKSGIEPRLKNLIENDFKLLDKVASKDLKKET